MREIPDDLLAEAPVVRHGLTFPFGHVRPHDGPMDIVPGVQWLQVPLSSKLNYINSWALKDGAGWAVVDMGMDLPDARTRWAELTAPDGPLGGSPTRMFATHMHGDHIGIAGVLHREHGCELWMTRGEYLTAKQIIDDYANPAPLPEHLEFFRRAGWTPEQLSTYQAFGKAMAPMPGQYHRMKEGDVIAIGEERWQVIVGTGHSPEHACLYNERQRLLIGGDHLLPDVSSNVSVMPVEPSGNPMKEWLDSLAKLGALFDDDVLVLPAHGSPFRGIQARVQQLASKRHRALERLVDHLQTSGPQRAVDLFGTLFSANVLAIPFQLTLATGETLAYLHYLMAEAQVQRERDAQGVDWYRLRA